MPHSFIHNLSTLFGVLSVLTAPTFPRDFVDCALISKFKRSAFKKWLAAPIIVATFAAAFGAVASAQTEPVGTASAPQTATVSVSSGFTLGSISVVTQGAPNLDFTFVSGGTCAAGTAYTAGQTCTVKYIFKPITPGLRMGAITLYDNTMPTPVLQATVFVSAAGTGPLVDFYHSAQSTVATGVGYAVAAAVDASGNLFIADPASNQVYKETPSVRGYTQTVIANSANNGISNPEGLAVDGAGNVYIANYGDGNVLKETLSGGSYTQSIVASATNGISNPPGVAVDAAGNFYIVDYFNSQILKETLTANGYAQSVIANATNNGLNAPWCVALDGAGNVYIADGTNGVAPRVLKETLTAGNYLQSVVVSNLLALGLAVDAAGSVYIAYSSTDSVLKETPSSSGYTASTVPTSGLGYPEALAVDASGNVYAGGPGNGAVFKEDFSDPPTLTFDPTDKGTISSDSPQTVTLWNDGNAVLTLPMPSSGNNPSVSANFSLNTTEASACPLETSTSTAEGTVVPGGNCLLSISFAPAASGQITGSLTLTDNEQNASAPSYARQSIALNGIGGPIQTTTTLRSSLSPSQVGQNITITASVVQALGPNTPVGTVQFTIDGSSVGAPVTVTASQATFSTSTLAAGTHSITAAFSPTSTAEFNASTAAAFTQQIISGAALPTATTLAIAAAGSPVTSVASGTTVALTATVLAGSVPVTGQVNFCDASAAHCIDIHLLGTTQLTANGTAVFEFRPGVGSHSYKAEYLGTSGGAKSSSVASTLIVTAPAGNFSSTTAINKSGNWDSYTLTAMVTGSGGTAAPSGTVSFLDRSNGNAVLGTATLATGNPQLGWAISQAAATGSFPSYVAVGDFNRDGIPDTTVSNANDNTVTILLGNGDGTFTAAPRLTIGGGPILVADLNGDGIPDLVLAESNTQALEILLGNGDGTFTAGPSPLKGNWLAAVAVGDLNGDGIPDLVIANGAASALTVLLGNGDGTFIKTASSPPTGSSPAAIAVADFNGDGNLDLAVANQESDTVTILLGDGKGDFTPVATSPQTGATPEAIVAGDFTGNGKVDLAVANAGGTTLTILLGNGDGTFTTAASPSLGTSPASIAIADFNNDGKADLAIAEYNVDLVSVLLGNGDGTFAAPVNIMPGVEPLSVATGDFNGDGKPDIAVALPNNGGAGAVAILLTEFAQTAIASGIAPTGLGQHLVVASYAGDTNFQSSISGTVLLQEPTPAPTITPGAGSYTSAQTVSISDATPGATIFYTTDGTIPPDSPTTMTYAHTPIPVSSNETINAVAVGTGYAQSAIAAATYTINLPPAATPVISLASGIYVGTQTVTITDATPGAAIYYSTNGSFITTASLHGPTPLTITIPLAETLVAQAIAPNYSFSLEATSEYLIQGVTTPYIYTVAGDGASGYTGDGGQATLADLNSPSKSVVDSAGNLYIADRGNNRVRKVTAATGVVTTIAGTGTPGYSGDAKAAIAAELNQPGSLALDSIGNLYIADSGNNVIRRITAATGIISTFAGTGTAGYNGDGEAATAADLYNPTGIAFDSDGNLYIADTYNGRIRRVAASTGMISTVAGDGNFAYSGDGLPAIDAAMFEPSGVAVDMQKNIYIADTFNNVIREVTYDNGIINTVAGSGYGASEFIGGYSGDGGPATTAELYFPQDVAVDNQLNLYIADTYNSVIRKVTRANGIINTFAGNNDYCYSASGDGGPALSGGVCYPSGVSLDPFGNVYVASTSYSRIEKVIVSANPPSVATAVPVFSVTGGSYPGPQIVTLSDATPGAAIYVTLDGTTPNGASTGYFGPINVTGTVNIKAIAVAPGYLPSSVVTAPYTITSKPASVITTFAGNGTMGFTGVGGQAAAAEVSFTHGVATDSKGNVFFTDTGNNLVWKVAAGTGIISIAAGNGTRGYSGDNGPASGAELSGPNALALDATGNLYIADEYNRVVRMVAGSTGVITTITGNGTSGYSGDNGPAVAAELATPDGLACDTVGNLYIADNSSSVIRRVNLNTGIITTFAGDGNYIFAGDGGLALAAGIPNPTALAVDGAGDLYIADQSNHLRKVTVSTGIITSVAGNGSYGYSGDGGQAINAEIQIQGIAFDKAGNLYIASDYSGTVREISAATGIITTIAGNGYGQFNGDGISATVAEMSYPNEIAFDAAGNLYIGDSNNFRIRKVTFQPPPAVTLSATSLSFGGVTVGNTSYSQQVTLTNTGTTALAVGRIAVTGTNTACFVFGNTCGTSVAVGANCTIHGHFAPTAAGAQTAAITITDSAGGSPQSIALTGMGADTTATLSASSLSFGIATVGTTTASQQLTLTNTGTAALLIGSIAVTGPNASSFVFGNSCGTSIAAGASCIVHGHFTPASEGAMTAAISINDSISGSPQNVTLTGTGVNPTIVTLSSTSLSFGTEQVGIVSPSQSVTLTNTGGSTLGITSIAVNGSDTSSFVFGNTCGTSVAAGASCTIHGHFDPTTTGALTAAITINDTATGSPKTIALSGTGANTTTISLSATSLSFGVALVGATTASQGVTLTNTGTGPFIISSFAVTGANASSFVFAHNCGTSLAAGNSCTIHGHFTPATTGALTASVTLADNATNSPQTLTLGGMGVTPTTASLSAASLPFGNQTVGSSSASKSVTLTNTGTSTLGIGSIALTGANASSFVFGNTCGSSVAAGGSCTIHGHFAPATTGALTATITITDTASGSPQTIALSGTGQ